MTRRAVIGFFVLPVLAVPVCMLLLQSLSSSAHQWFVSETGPVELGTAFLFLAAAAVAGVHVYRHRAMPRMYRGLLVLFAMASLFVAMEELSYGQHLLKFENPEYFQQHNDKQELNLHNLYDNKPSRRIRLFGSLAIPFVCVVLPLLYRPRPEAWQPGHWTFYLLPRLELAAFAITAQLLTLPNRIPNSPIGTLTRPGEFKELYWAAAALCYAWLLERRYRLSQEATEPAVSLPAGATPQPATKRAA